ncbi:hypothetical protein [Streptomyces malaysiensis]|uniref:hypothetical protein n=1 Tax=Streptomyces malaysiensis TaxID=92644 RepID=UPI0036BD3F46
MFRLAKAAIVGGLAAATLVVCGVQAHESKPAPLSVFEYTKRVQARTDWYRPCLDLMQSENGDSAYTDLVDDSWDEGKRRSVSEQIEYVRTGCENGA